MSGKILQFGGNESSSSSSSDSDSEGEDDKSQKPKLQSWATIDAKTLNKTLNKIPKTVTETKISKTSKTLQDMITQRKQTMMKNIYDPDPDYVQQKSQQRKKSAFYSNRRNNNKTLKPIAKVKRGRGRPRKFPGTTKKKESALQKRDRIKKENNKMMRDILHQLGDHKSNILVWIFAPLLDLLSREETRVNSLIPKNLILYFIDQWEGIQQTKLS